jgi:acetone carboxylase gamma subunit
MRLNDYLTLEERDGQYVIQCRCGHAIGPATENYKLHVICNVAPLSKAGPHVNPYGVGEGRFALREYCCPSCLTLLDVEVALRDEPPRWDLQPAVPQSRAAVRGGE